MPLPKLPPPPKSGNDALDKWLLLHYHWLGQASGDSELTAVNITQPLDVGRQVTGVLAAENLVPNAQPNTTNFATVDSIDAGADATIRVYGLGGVGTPWTRVVGSTTEGPFPAATLPGFAYAAIREIYFRASDSSFFAFDPDTEYLSTLANDLRWVGEVKTVAAGGTGGTSGGGGTVGGGGGARYGNRALIL